MDEMKAIGLHRATYQPIISIKDITQNNEKEVLTLRKEKMFSCLMSKRQFTLFTSIKDNEESKQQNHSLKKNNTFEEKCSSELLKYSLLHQFSSSNELLQQIKQYYYTQNETQLQKLLEEINSELNEKRITNILSDVNLIDFIIKIFMQCETENIFYVCSSIMVHYTYNNEYTTLKFHTVKFLNKLIDKVFNSFQNKNIFTNVLTIIWNIYNDYGNGIISQTELFYYLSLLIVSDEQLDEGNQKSFQDALLLNIFLLLQNNNFTSLKPQISQFIPFLVNVINNYSIQNDQCEQLFCILMIYLPLSNDDDLCQLMLKEGLMNYLCCLFQYLFLTNNEIFAKRKLVLNSNCVNCIIRIFGNFFSMSDTIISAMLPENLFFSILMELVKRHTEITRPFENNDELYFSTQVELMSLIANISACDIMSLKDFIGGQNELIKVIITKFSENNQALLHIIHIIENIFIRDNTKAIIVLQNYNYLNVIHKVLIQTNLQVDIKIGALRVLILLIQNISESNKDYPFDFILELEKRDMVNLIQILYDQSNDILFSSFCNKFIKMMLKNERSI